MQHVFYCGFEIGDMALRFGARSFLQTNDTALTCANQIVVTVAIPNNNLYASSELMFDLPCVNRYVDCKRLRC